MTELVIKTAAGYKHTNFISQLTEEDDSSIVTGSTDLETRGQFWMCLINVSNLFTEHTMATPMQDVGKQVSLFNPAWVRV